MGARDIPDHYELLDAAALVSSVWREFLRPAAVQTVTEWAEKNRVLSAKDSAEAGPYRVARTPYAREPQDALSAHSGVEEVVLMWGAQTSKTTIGSNWQGYQIDTNPGPMMIVQPTIDMAKRYSRQRLSPMIDESPVLKRKVRENRSRDEANTTLLKEYTGGFLAVAGANSAAGLRSMPVRDLFLDEIDGYPLDVDGEGDPCQLAEARQTTFSRRKRLKTSTPTTKDFSRIEAAFDASDRCRYHVPCPHCGESQWLEWGADQAHGIKWDTHPETGAPRPDTVRYICKHHGCEIREHLKPGMLAAGRWISENPGAQAGRVRGFQLSSLYSPLGWLSWAELAQEWHEAMIARRGGDISLLRVFVNTRLAETFEEQGDKADAHVLAKRAEDYALATVPWGGLVVVAACDVQGDRLEAYAWAMGRGEEMWLADRRAWYGDPSVPEGQPGSLWDQLTEWRRTPLRHASGAELRIRACGVDSGGHHTQLVYAYARRYAAEHVLALKGASQAARPILGKPTDVEINHLGQRLKKGCKLWPIGTDTAKALFYSRLRVEQPGPGYVHFSRQLDGSVYEQLTAERLVTRYYKGRPKLEWVKPASKRNEALDIAVYAIAVSYYLGIHRYTDVHWQRLESSIRQADLLASAPQTAEQEKRLEPTAQDATIPPQEHNEEPLPTQAVAVAQDPPQHQPAPKAARTRVPRRNSWATKW
jgi:phage terminase large subunit GpA-like protein